MAAQRGGLLDGVARRAGDVGDNDAVKARQTVEKTGFSRVRAAEDGGPDAGLHHPTPVAGGEERRERAAAFGERVFKPGKLKRVDILVRIVQNGVEMRADIDPAVIDGVNFPADRTGDLTGGVRCGVGGLGIDEIDDGFCLRQIHPAVQKRAAGELARPCLPEARRKQRFQSRGQRRRRAVALDLRGILAGVGVRRAGNERHAVIKLPSLHVIERAERELAVGQGCERLARARPEDGPGRFDAPVAGQAQNADARPGMAGGNGGNFISHGFLLTGRRPGCPCAGAA